MSGTAQHTPGPWGVDNPLDERATELIITSGSWVICELADGLNEEGEMEANANLIAAAPQLLAELKKARTLLRLLTVRQVIEAGDPFIEASGLNPWCINEGLGTGDERLNLFLVDYAIDKAEGKVSE